MNDKIDQGGDVLGGSPGQGAVPQTFALPGVWARITGSAAGTGDVAGRTAYTWVQVVESDAAGDFPDDTSDFAVPNADLPAVEINNATVADGTKVRLHLSPTQTYYVFAAAGTGGGGTECCLWGGDPATATTSPDWTNPGVDVIGYVYTFSGVTGAQTVSGSPVDATVPANSGLVMVHTQFTCYFTGTSSVDGEEYIGVTAKLIAKELGGTTLGELTPWLPVVSGQFLKPSPLTAFYESFGDAYKLSLTNDGVDGPTYAPSWCGSSPAVLRQIPDHSTAVVLFWQVMVEIGSNQGAAPWSGTIKYFPPGTGATFCEWWKKCCPPS